jgi:hypothetical protein
MAPYTEITDEPPFTHGGIPSMPGRVICDESSEFVTKPRGFVSTDMVRHPPHYTSHPSGVECIQITRHMNFCCGNVIKYLWRLGLKDAAIEGKTLQDLEKARQYLDFEIERVKEAMNADT